METPIFSIPESRLQGTLGISRDALRAIRQKHLKEGRHWQTKGRRIYLSSFGAAAYERILAVAKKKPAPPAASTPAKKAAPAQRAEHPGRELVVTGTFPKIKNRGLVEVQFVGQENGPTMILRVRDNRLWKIGVHVAPETYETTPTQNLLEYTAGRAPKR